MDIFRLVYCSRAVQRLDRSALVEILNGSRPRNSAHGITGVLCYSAPVFLQWLEGPWSEVNRTLARIAKDQRHADLAVVDARFVPERVFPNWGMEFLDLAHLPVELAQRLFDASLTDEGIGATDMQQVLELLGQVALVQTPRPRSAPERSSSDVRAYPVREPSSDVK